MSLQTQVQKMYLAGDWVQSEAMIDVLNPQDGSVVAAVPAATADDMLAAVEAAKQGAQLAAELPTHERMAILHRTVEYIFKYQEKFAMTIASEGSKTMTEARGEVTRCIETLRLSAEEARRIHGETIPFDQVPGKEQRMGYYYRFPIGIIGAITPFNDPLNLVAHKIGPAIASGNAIIVKPASETPLSALLLAEAFEAAGLPRKILTVITGRGGEIGDVLVTHPAVRMVSFTGGLETGEDIARKAGLKKLSMELGSNSPLIVLDDARLDQAIDAAVSGAFSAAGQNCIGVQRIYVQSSVYDVFAEQMVKRTKSVKTGDKLAQDTDMGPMINEKEARRVESWVQDAIFKGARLLIGGTRTGAFMQPTILSDVPDEATIAKQEIFGPVVLLYPVGDLSEAIDKANDVDYGLQAGIFTNNINDAFATIKHLNVGGVMINDSSDFRIDAMPFGGVKGSGLGREGVKFTVEEMTEPKVVCFQLDQPRADFL